jgi:BirA family transcriptional regulator, biotin operon repressor / biotin---[acetyl-CoA-carboxylase] ligase
MQLDPSATSAGARLLAFESLTSTNFEALILARRGEQGPLWIVAGRQTAGRGRRGNEWISEPGNLYATLLLSDPGPAERAPELSFVAALAVHDAIVTCARELRARLAFKWPNDVLCAGAKLGGILIESEIVGTRLVMAIGIGVNCRHHPSQTTYPATDLAAAGAEVSASDLFCALSAAMVQRLSQWRGGGGFSEIRSDWLDRAIGIGAGMTVRLPGRELFGRCEALDVHGRLLLRLADGTLETIAAGDVFPVTFSGQPSADQSGSVD